MRQVSINLQHKDISALKCIQDVLNSPNGEPQTVKLSIKNANYVKSKQLIPDDNMLFMPKYFFEQLYIMEAPSLDDQTIVFVYELDYIYVDITYQSNQHEAFMHDIDSAVLGELGYNNKISSIIFSHGAWHKFLSNPAIVNMQAQADRHNQTFFGIKYRRADNMTDSVVRVAYIENNPKPPVTEIQP